MFILIIFLLIGIAFKREIKTIISFLFLGIVVMYFWDDIKLIALILSIFGCLLTLYLTIVAVFTKEKIKAVRYLSISILCFLIVCIGIVTDDTSAIQTEDSTIRVENQLKI
ncbi:hypothetical protein C2I18_14135 [Paenibacillus sp. PK3_47]|nr:hypothetical protein C2I18_14135 [Paenibacillus sp. PK3_47]